MYNCYLCYLSIDFVIHFIIRYGMNEAILFGGHWMFAVPILLGWLYTRLPVRMYRILDWVIIGFFVLTATINIDGVYAFLLIRLK